MYESAVVHNSRLLAGEDDFVSKVATKDTIREGPARAHMLSSGTVISVVQFHWVVAVKALGWLTRWRCAGEYWNLIFRQVVKASRLDVLIQTQDAHVQEHRCPGVLCGS